MSELSMLHLLGFFEVSIITFRSFRKCSLDRIKNDILQMTKIISIAFIMYNFVDVSSVSQKKLNKFWSSN